MENTYWYSNHHFFDYNREEEIEDLTDEFLNPDNVFLIASDNNGSPMGTISLKIKGERVTIRRREPAILDRYRSMNVAESLIKEALEIANNRAVKIIHTNLKFPYDSHEPWLCEEYRRLGFAEQKIKVNLIKKLDGTQLDSISSVDMKSYHNYNVDEITEFTLRAFASTLKDIEIHGKDPTVSNPEYARETIIIQRAGKLGKSPPDINQVAIIEGEPAGFIRCFIREEKCRPSFGLIGILGIFPEYRRKGICHSLINQALMKFKEHGLQYTYIGTKENNQKAMKAYKNAGFQPIFKQITFEKKL